jgi:hypothetical protein
MKKKETAWFRFGTATVHILGGANCDQPYDFTNACSTCGAGAVAMSPLIADLNAMGKKDLDFTAHDGQIIITKRVADALADSSLTGFTLDTVRHHKKPEPDPRFAWLRIQSQWVAMHKDSVFEMDEECPECRRSGHCDSIEPPTDLRFDAPPQDAQDFSRTWEYWGVWNSPLASGPKVGGAQLPIVSARVKQFLSELKIKRLRFDPIHFAE